MSRREGLSAAGAHHLRLMTKPGLEILATRDRHSYHSAGFTQDVHALDGTLLHAELTDDGFWKLTEADTGEDAGLFIPTIGD